MHMTRRTRGKGLILACLTLALLGFASSVSAQLLDDYIIVNSNDLGMHCMNRDHAVLSILPPYNTINAQVIRRGDEVNRPQIVTDGITLEYSIPGNTYSAGKTDFWDWVFHLFGVNLPPDVGLTGNGLEGEFDVHGNMLIAEGIPITPYTDAEPTVEDPYQQALVILRDEMGEELARSRPVLPVSTEVGCLNAGCHTSELGILYQHTDDHGFDPNNRPILCASCHGSPPLTGPEPGPHDYFSKVIHDKHSFIDEQIPGLDGCQQCHPGPQTQCLRGTMSNDYGMICQDCHGDMDQVAGSIEEGRTPWLDEPACRDCHTSVYGEPVGQLYRNSTGHGGVLCSGCHNSPHATFPSREARDNQVMIDLQGHAGTLSDCTVCHRVTPDGPGPHGIVPTGVIEDEIFAAAGRLTIYPTPTNRGAECTIMARSRSPQNGRLLVFDVRGRTVRMLRAEADGHDQARILWDGRDAHGRQVASGTYFLRWDDGIRQAAGKVVVVN